MPEKYQQFKPHPLHGLNKAKHEAYVLQMNEDLASKKKWAAQATAKILAERARAVGVWLYDPDIKEWYSPEEFEEMFSKLFAGNGMFQRVQFRDPVEGIAAGFKQMDIVKEKLVKLVDRVINYYSGVHPPMSPGA